MVKAWRRVGYLMGVMACLSAAPGLRAQEKPQDAGQQTGQAAETRPGRQVQVWFDARFDEQGRLVEARPVNDPPQPEGLWQALMPRIQNARIDPPQLDGQPATLSTGLLVLLKWRESEGRTTMELASVRPAALPLVRHMLAPPREVTSVEEWEGRINIRCQVNTEGRCDDIQVEAPAGVPVSVRRWAKASMAQWRFRPQQLNGQPVASVVQVPLVLSVHGRVYPQDFREPRKL